MVKSAKKKFIYSSEKGFELVDNDSVNMIAIEKINSLASDLSKELNIEYSGLWKMLHLVRDWSIEEIALIKDDKDILNYKSNLGS